jgi:hypothetical protein
MHSLYISQLCLSLQQKCDMSLLETSGFSPMVISWFLMNWVKSRHGFYMKKSFLRFVLSFFINYIVISSFCLCGKSFNEDRNHHQYIIGTALRSFGCINFHIFENLESSESGKSEATIYKIFNIPRFRSIWLLDK